MKTQLNVWTGPYLREVYFFDFWMDHGAGQLGMSDSPL